MSEQTQNPSPTPEDQDTKTDLRAVIIIFCAAIAMAIHFVSGLTFHF